MTCRHDFDLKTYNYLITFFAAPLGSIIINKFGYRICSVVGGFLAATGISVGYFANDILFLFFTHGILTGQHFLLSVNSGEIGLCFITCCFLHQR